jgi:hypothetical protein
MHCHRAAAVVFLSVLLVGCGQEDAVPEPAPESMPPAMDSPRSAPDFGGITNVSVESVGFGADQQAALLQALDSAIAQVNGRRVASRSESHSASFVVELPGAATQIDSAVLMQSIVSASNGAITSYEILGVEEVPIAVAEQSSSVQETSSGWLTGRNSETRTSDRISRFGWKVTVRASVAKFAAPDSGRPKIVIASPRLSAANFEVGDRTLPAIDVAREFQAKLIDNLTQSGRFDVLGRDFADEVQTELDFIAGDNARTQEIARLGQQFAADLILIMTIDRFEYRRRSQQLRMSDRQLVSYDGGGRVSVRLLNATTGVLIAAEAFDVPVASMEPSTMPRAVKSAEIAADMTAVATEKISSMIIRRVFPVSVVAIEGNVVVLSQGGASVRVGERYEAVLLGSEMRDPQTGASLGRMEIPCCIIRVDRVSDQTSYGTIEGERPSQLVDFRPGFIELRGKAPEPVAVAATSRSSSGVVEAAAPVPNSLNQQQPQQQPRQQPVQPQQPAQPQ